MLLTETEARQKNCPFAPRRIIASVQYGDTPAHWESRCGCAASKCMAWRWSTEFEIKEQPRPRGFWAFLAPTEYFPRISAKESSRGYCGLAGRGR